MMMIIKPLGIVINFAGTVFPEVNNSSIRFLNANVKGFTNADIFLCLRYFCFPAACTIGHNLYLLNETFASFACSRKLFVKIFVFPKINTILCFG